MHRCPIGATDDPMAMYYFDTFENGEHVEDDEGLECSTPEQVRCEAMKALPSIAKE
jgi:hypothetical protein